MEKEIYLWDGINGSLDQFEDVEEAQKFIKREFIDYEDGIHPDIESVWIMKKLFDTQVIEDDKGFHRVEFVELNTAKGEHKTAEEILNKIFYKPEMRDWYKPVLKAMEEYYDQARQLVIDRDLRYGQILAESNKEIEKLKSTFKAKNDIITNVTLRGVKLIEALQEAINGLEWRIETDPATVDNSDYEKLEEWKNLINKEENK